MPKHFDLSIHTEKKRPNCHLNVKSIRGPRRKKYLCKVSFVNRLKQRWNVEKAWMVWVILLVFALTGFTVMYLKKFVKPYLGEDWWVDVVYYVLILPVYNVLLLTYGFCLGQFRYFWNFEKRFFKRIVDSFK